jgi:hypothetical protein
MVQEQLRDFIRRGVADALEKTSGVVDASASNTWMLEIFEAAFEILRSLGDQEARE